MTPSRGAWLPMKALQKVSVLSGPGALEYKCRVKVSRNGQKLRVFMTLGPRNVKAIFLDSDGNITSQGHGETVAEAAHDAGAEGEL